LLFRHWNIFNYGFVHSVFLTSESLATRTVITALIFIFDELTCRWRHNFYSFKKEKLGWSNEWIIDFRCLVIANLTVRYLDLIGLQKFLYCYHDSKSILWCLTFVDPRFCTILLCLTGNTLSSIRVIDRRALVIQI